MSLHYVLQKRNYLVNKTIDCRICIVEFNRLLNIISIIIVDSSTQRILSSYNRGKDLIQRSLKVINKLNSIQITQAAYRNKLIQTARKFEYDNLQKWPLKLSYLFTYIPLRKEWLKIQWSIFMRTNRKVVQNFYLRLSTAGRFLSIPYEIVRGGTSWSWIPVLLKTPMCPVFSRYFFFFFFENLKYINVWAQLHGSQLAIDFS